MESLILMDGSDLLKGERRVCLEMLSVLLGITEAVYDARRSDSILYCLIRLCLQVT